MKARPESAQTLIADVRLPGTLRLGQALLTEEPLVHAPTDREPGGICGAPVTEPITFCEPTDRYAVFEQHADIG